MTRTPVTITPGFTPTERPVVAQLFWEAFRGKLQRVMGPEDKALALITRILDPGFALSARDADGVLLGVAGFKTATGSLTGGKLSDMRSVYGLLGGIWRGLVLSVLERDIEDDILVMDGIFVTAAARGRGVGGALLDAICAEAAQSGLSRVRLDVIDTNPRARALYERKGFRAVGAEQTGVFRAVFGFRSATRMERAVT